MAAFTLLVLGNPAAPHLKRLARLPEATRIVAGETAEAFAHAVGEAEIVLCGGTSRDLLRTLLPQMPRLRWIHALAAGLDGLLFPELIGSPVPLTNSRGVFAPSLGEFCIAGMMWFAKDLRRMLRQQEAAVWDSFDVDMLEGKTLGIVGYGSIGRESAQRAAALGMRVLALRNNPRPDPHAHSVYGLDQLTTVLDRADYLLVAAPLTPETRGMIGAAQLARLKPEAVVINLGRGPVIDEAALAEALAARRIRGAVLDVFEAEPLPPESPFWKLDNVLLSPHCADHVPGWMESAMDLFIENFRRFEHGAPLENVADKSKGY